LSQMSLSDRVFLFIGSLECGGRKMPRLARSTSRVG
jgi:hypothetical protein